MMPSVRSTSLSSRSPARRQRSIPCRSRANAPPLTFVLPEPAGRSLEDIAVHIPALTIGHPLIAEKVQVP
jgi:hypothetical protein